MLKVRSLARSVPFYREVLGLTEVARHGGRMVFFSSGENHHDLALLEIGEDAPPPVDRQVGLYHLAFKVGDSLDDLRACRDHLLAHGVDIDGQSDHRVSQSVYCHDPDGIMIELYVDADPALWRDDPSAVAYIGALKL
ncbi:MAG: VOC family protein [Gammaproteobacteria bacterium]